MRRDPSDGMAVNEKSYLLENMRSDPPPTLPRSNSYVSPSTVTTLEELQEELEKGQVRSEEETWEKFGRRTLYGSLPFMAAFGMHKKEAAMKKVISAVSMNTLAKLHLDKELMKEVGRIIVYFYFRDSYRLYG